MANGENTLGESFAWQRMSSLQELLKSLTGRGQRARNTIKSYRKSNTLYAQFLAERGLSREEFEAMPVWLQQIWLGLDESASGDGGVGRSWLPGEQEMEARRLDQADLDRNILQQRADEEGRSNQALEYIRALEMQGQDRQFRERLGLDRDIFGLNEKELDELIRANQADEAARARDRALAAAQSAVQNYLQAQSQADARRLSSVQEQRLLLPSMVDPNQQYFSGLGPDDPLAAMMGEFGLPFNPAPIQHTQIDAGALANPPVLGEDILSQIRNMQGIGAQ